MRSFLIILAVIAAFTSPVRTACAADDFDNLLNDINTVQKETAGPEAKKAMEECEAIAKAVTESEKSEKENVTNISDMKIKYIKDINLKDPWGGEYILESVKGRVYSKGPDGKAGTADDITASYTPEKAAEKKEGAEPLKDAKKEDVPVEVAKPDKKEEKNGEPEKVIIGGDTAPPAPQKTEPPKQPEKTRDTAERIIFKNGNIGGVDSNPRTVPSSPTMFTIHEPVFVTYLDTYHYFNRGKKPGTIALRHEDGTMYGPWRTTGIMGQGKVPNATWVCNPNVEIKAGTYTVIDSDPKTWSYNYESQGAGFAIIKGY